MSLYGALRYGTNLLASLTRPGTDTRAAPTADDWAVDCSSPTAQDGTEISAEWANEVTANIRSAIRLNGLTGGGAAIVAETGVDTQLALGIQHFVQRGRANYCVDTGAADAYVVTPTPTPAELIDGLEFKVLIANTNLTTSPTFNGGVGGALAVKTVTGAALAIGAIVSGTVGTFRYHAGSGFWRFSSGSGSLSSSGAAILAIYHYTSSTTYTPNPSAGHILVLVRGGGGAGGVHNSCGPGGGQGGLGIYFGSMPGLAQTVTIGAGGTCANSSSNSSGGDGGATSFGSFCTGNGGQGGKGAGSNWDQGGLGGTGSGSFSIPGIPGGNTIGMSGYYCGNGGGPGGGRGASQPSGYGTGENASGYGSGGGGGDQSISSPVKGGDGMGGDVWVIELA